jgi:5-methylcytosine-specific restriction enzyme subunit McrC
MWHVSRLILQQRTLRDQEGAVACISFTVDMNTLFERFVERVVREAAEQAGWELVAQAPRRLTARVAMFPDLVLRDGGRDCAVADAKYKEPEEWYNSDLYQLLAYCAALGLPRGLSIYGGPRPLERQTVERIGIHLELVGIDLGMSPERILLQAREVAAHLIRQAAAAAHPLAPAV